MSKFFYSFLWIVVGDWGSGGTLCITFIGHVDASLGVGNGGLSYAGLELPFVDVGYLGSKFINASFYVS